MSDASALRFGICGLGFMGQTYFRRLGAHAHARVVAVCDADAHRRAGRWEKKIGNVVGTGGSAVDMTEISAYAAFDDLLADDAVDVVAITLPTPLHAEMTARALHAGKHVLCEKPMALTLAECDRMIDAARATGGTLMIAQCIRFWPQYERIGEIVRAGEIGEIRCATLRRLGCAPGSTGNWMMDGTKSGGALFDLHVHDIDFAQMLFGMPDRVQASGSTGPSGAIDHVLATWEYDDGRYLAFEGSWTHIPPWPFEMGITVLGETGTLDWSMTRGDEVMLYARDEAPQRLRVPKEDGWTRELDYFIACVRGHRPTDRCTPESSRASIALALRERESIESRQMISL